MMRAKDFLNQPDAATRYMRLAELEAQALEAEKVVPHAQDNVWVATRYEFRGIQTLSPPELVELMESLTEKLYLLKLLEGNSKC